MKMPSFLRTPTALLLLLTGLGQQFVQAQNKPISLKDAVTFALANKADAQKAKLDIENAGYEIQEVRAGALPTVSANGNLTYNAIIQQSALPGDIVGAPGTVVLIPFGQEWLSTAGVSLSQNIFDMSVFTGLKAAKSTRQFYQINASLTEEQVIERVANAYYQVLVAQEKLAVSDSLYQSTAKVRDIIKGQFDNGLAKKIDLDRTMVNLYNLDTERQQNRNNVALQETALKFYMGMPVETPITLVKEHIEVKPLALDEQPNSTNRFEYQLMTTQEQLYKYQKQSKVAAYYPTLSLNAYYNYQGTGQEFPWFSKPVDGTYWTDYASIGLNLKVPIFSGLGNRARVGKADVELRKHQQDMADKKLSLDKEYFDAVTVIKNNLKTLESQTENVTLARDVLDDTLNNYYNGLATLTDLLDSEQAYTQAQNNYNTALLNYKLAEVQFIKSKGQLKSLAQ
ncbi:TolC family protein [Flavobacterium caeni]|uniref:Outer membrane protein TolC n=1 Tax=Flavobacterium caeni TaxID=490189 RepID=A0A1G5EIG2_9FLAO|nr:TolC family protein [Flavobacterium caeni]SCY26736.1 Outer membrane protein TolC [Flavobacterium caeni]